MEVDEAQAVFHSLLIEDFECGQQLRARKPELARVAAALLPLAAARRCQLNPYAEVGLNVQLLGGAAYDVKLVQLLHHDEYSLAHLLRQQGQLDVALVLVAVADYERVALALHRDDGVQLGLRAGLEAEVELAPVADNLLDDGLHLVNLDGIDDEVLPLETVFVRRFLETAPRFLNPVVEDVGEAEQHRRGNVPERKFVHHVVKVYLHVVLARGDIHIAALVDAEVGCSPPADVVKLVRVFDSPFLHLGLACFLD